ncbi:hypothetical protein M409DRAFT_61245 [Zasmidium cellare ATCC 36951]|uniref:Uncharacterized protein n=1 Tax=Zasmidium cellare ATCC 36951 TaxID=1080233 RepID=A0A6A6BXV9_ZASCE|nr:uncharacterized protein M409DRAFT_61245 [Zasmidium cellare ATCC 36951]KAF2158898.1 hypothetical protein M409DRAFT_61245 [Zasmidium cellare ATCC 36951]
MNGRISPDPPTTQAGDSGKDESTLVGSNDSTANHDPSEIRLKSSPPRPKSAGKDVSSDLNEVKAQEEGSKVNGDEDGVDSEAETLIDSPVKRQQAERRRSNAAKMERPPKHRIGSLPVPTGNDDEDDSANVSPAPSTAMSVEKTTSTEDLKDVNMDNMGDDKDDDSDSLSSPRSNASNPASRRSSMSRAASERPGLSRNDQHSPNPRKRKHRASSVSLPNKRPSIDIPKRRLRGLHSEELGRHDESLSPKLRSHRRAVSTQSAFTDGIGEASGNRKRRAGTQGLGKEPKSARSGWEESDASSEATSHGNPDSRRPQRGVGRSTSTPGRPVGREHKRHVNKYGFTRLAEACENGDLDLVKDWCEKDPDQLELAEFAGNKPLQIAALNGNVEVVDYLIDQGCQIDCANVDKDTPLIDAAENGHLEVVNSLLNAGVDPLRQNLKGQQALDVVTDEVDDAEEIRATLRKAIEKWNSTGAKQKREEAEEMRHRAGPSKELHFMARTYENLLRLVQINDRTGVREFLDARVPVDNAVVAAAAKTGDTYLVNMLLAEMTEKKAHQKAEKPLLGVLGSSHFEMVKSLTELDNFNPLFRNRQQKTWPEIAEERHGPNWRQEYELLQRLYDQAASLKERRSSSPVTKRDSGKRRFVHRAEEEDSEEEEAPKRRNNRKLMSKREQRELRAARGKPTSDESSDESSSEQATGAEAAEEKSMKPPESPASKRTPPTRSRTKSLSAQAPEPSPRTRRRSSSVRGAGDNLLPTVQENTEEKEAAERQKEEEQKRVAEEAEQARLAEVRRKEQEQAEAEAAAKRAAEEEEARRMEEERKAEEARRIEEERKAQAARDAEEERIRKQREAEEAKRAHRKEVVASLPNPIAHVLRPDSGFDYSSSDLKDLTYIIRLLTPLQVIKHEYGGPYAHLPASDDAPFWVMNVQVAPLLDKRGAELMISSEKPGYEGSLADTWETKEVQEKEVNLVISLLSNGSQALPDEPKVPKDKAGNSLLSWQEELERASKVQKASIDAKKRLREGAAKLRYVRLDDVLKNLHPLLQQVNIEVRFDHLKPAPSPVKDEGGFFGRVGSAINRKPVPRTYVNGTPIDLKSPVTATGTTQVTVIHPKK